MEQMTEQMLERLRAKVRAEMKSQIGDSISWMTAHQSKTEANREDGMATVESQSREDSSPDGCQSKDDGGLPRKY
jgi:hypothetical protein